MRRVPLLIGFVFLLSASAAGAQVDTGSISGRITDQDGQVLAGVSVSITNDDTGFGLSTTTNLDGVYLLTGLRPDSYRMTVEMRGFRTINLTDLVLEVQDALGRNFAMQVGPREETVTVVAGQEEGTLSSAVSTVVDQKFVANMPLNGRSFQSLIYATPGIVITPTDPFLQTQFSTNGQRPGANYFTIDGVSANFGATWVNTGTNYYNVGLTLGGTTPAMTTGGGTGALVSVDAMQEFRTQTSTYAPEFGRSPGAQISIVTKSGTNLWHGSAFEYFRDDIFDARNYFDRAHAQNGRPALPKPPLSQNDFGGTVGGALRKDHTFFFFSYEGLRLRLPKTAEGLFFTASAKASVSGRWAPVINATPTGTGALYDPTCDNVTKPCLAALREGYTDSLNDDSYSLRIDHRLTGKITAFSRYSHTRSASDALSNFNQDKRIYANTDMVTAGLTAVIGPTMVNDFRGNWSQQASGTTERFIPNYGSVAPSNWADVVPPGYGGKSSAILYYFDILGADSGLGLGSLGAQSTQQLNFVDTLSKTFRTHLLKFGLDYRRIRPYEQPSNEILAISYSWASVLSGRVDADLNYTGDPLTVHVNNWSLFGQDTWKLSDRLSLTYGVRWDINTSPVSDTPGKPFYSLDGVFDNGPLMLTTRALWNTDYGGIAPRIGAVWQLNPRTTIRGGFGPFYDLGYGGAVANAFADFPYYRQTYFGRIPFDFSYRDPATSFYPYQSLPFTTQLGSSNFAITVDPHLKLPVTYQWNAALERQFGPQSVTVTYVGAYGRKLLYSTTLPLQSQGVQFYDTPTWNAGNSHYNGLQAKLMRRMTRGLQALVSYSYSHSNDTASDDYNLFGNTFSSIETVKLPPLTPSDFDYRNAFSAVLSYEIPKPPWGREVAQRVLGDWALDGIYKFQSTPPLDVSIAETDPVLDYIVVRPTRIPGQPIWIPDSSEPAGRRLNPSAFTLKSNGDSDDAFRNSIRSPYNISQVDLALRRSFDLTDRIKLAFRIEYFNLLNHPMFGGPLGPWTYWGACGGNSPASCSGPDAYQNPSFGKVLNGETLKTTPGQTLNIGLGSQSPQYAPGGPRSGQFTLKLQF